MMRLVPLSVSLALVLGALGGSSFAEDATAGIEAGMKCATEKFGLAGSNVFRGDPLTASAGPSYAREPKFEGYNAGSRNPKLASFPSGVGLIGRAWASDSGFDSSEDVQKLPGDKFLRLALAKQFGVHGTIGIRFEQYDAVIEFYADKPQKDWDVAGIKSCFE